MSATAMIALHITVNTEKVPDVIAVLNEHPDVAELTYSASTPPRRRPRGRHAAERPTTRLRRMRNAQRPAEPAEDIRQAAHSLFSCIDELHTGYGYPFVDFEFRAYQAVQNARLLLGQQPDATLTDLLEIFAPVMDEWWPQNEDMLPAARAACEAVERIRRATAAARYGLKAPEPQEITTSAA